jgi:hypothetical protein
MIIFKIKVKNPIAKCIGQWYDLDNYESLQN